VENCGVGAHARPKEVCHGSHKEGLAKQNLTAGALRDLCVYVDIPHDVRREPPSGDISLLGKMQIKNLNGWSVLMRPTLE
jgi:hypothetical protein